MINNLCHRLLIIMLGVALSACGSGGADIGSENERRLLADLHYLSRYIWNYVN